MARTPNIDRLAAQGCRFPNAFCTAPVCSPSRTSIITGCYSTTQSAAHMRTMYPGPGGEDLPGPYKAVPPPFVHCFTADLRAAGYYCTNNGKTDYQFPSPGYAWDANGAGPGGGIRGLEEIHWRNRPDTAQPFFAVFNLIDTHEHYMWEEEHPVVHTDPASVTVPPFLPDTPVVRRALARHYDNIARNDALVGRLLDQLEADGLAENTMVILWSDHGEGLPRAKRFLYDSGIRIPLIVRSPGRVPSATVDERLISLIDLAPTLLAEAGLPLPAHLHGAPLFGPRARSRDYVFAHADRFDAEYTKARAVRSQRWKYIRNYQPGGERLGFSDYRAQHPAMQAIRLAQLEGDSRWDTPGAPEELYDLDMDPHELHNLADEPEASPVLEELRAALDAWQTRHDPDLATREEVIAERCWPGGLQPVTAQAQAFLYTQGNPRGRVLTAKDSEDVITWAGPALLQLHSPTEGRTISYQWGDDPVWRIYRTPLHLPAGTQTTIRVIAERLGYAPSPETLFHLQSTSAATTT